MPVFIADPNVEVRLKAEREASGSDRWDEVWEGVYYIMPLPNNEHQQIATVMGTIFQISVGWKGLGDVLVGVNVSDREEDWLYNYRCPDLAVFLKGTKAKNCGTHWRGGPEFAVEIASSGDRSREKLAFYAGVGVEELLLIDRDPWALEFFQRRKKSLVKAGHATVKPATVLSSKVLPLHFRLVPGTARPQIEISHADEVQCWLI